MNNKEKYINSIEEIHANEELKKKTMQNIREKNIFSDPIIKLVSVAAVVMLIFSFGLLYYDREEKAKNPIAIENSIITENPKEVEPEDDLPRFANIDELKEVLEKNKANLRTATKGYLNDAVSAIPATESSAQSEDFSRTNTQVENVDEADIVKTDGNFIYYVKGEKVLIIDAKSLKKVAEIKVENEDNKFYPTDIYINNNKLIALGSYEEKVEKHYSGSDEVDEVYVDRAYVRNSIFATAIVFDITNKENPKQVRKVALDGNYMQSRMIGDNIYFISNKYLYYYYNDNLKDNEILPMVEENGIRKSIPVTDIIYFKDSNETNYMMVAGFNINNLEEANIVTFFGASDIVYASENNLYIAKPNYWSDNENKTTIYKFNLKDSEVKLLCKGEVIGDLNNQFSMDEYNGNLRVATTEYNYSMYDTETVNRLFILNDEMKIIGKIDNMAEGEKIYSVRFMGNKGYIVTFEQIDPLFVIDLSDPTNPEVKGELKIPGYSSYLHPYDENHIIGIGYNTKDNGYGGQIRDTMKMSMFDVSDVSNPKELFNVTIGNSYTYSEITYNHKSLFYNKEKNLIGFPLTLEDYDYSESRYGFIIYKIDLDKGFEQYCQIVQPIDYNSRIQRGIYIGDTLYTIAYNEISAYDLITFEEKGILNLRDKNEIIYEVY